MNLLHLVDGGSPQAEPVGLAMLADGLGRLGPIRQHVILLGGTTLRQQAAAVGIKPARVIGAPLGNLWLTWPALRWHLRDLCRGEGLAGFDVVHCWSVRALMLATAMLGDRPRVLTLMLEPDARELAWLRATLASAAGRVAILAANQTIHRGLVTAGVDPACARLLPPALDFGRLAHARRDAIRRSWGLDDPSPGVAPNFARQAVPVAALLSHPIAAADAMAASLVAGMAGDASTGPLAGLRLLVHPRQAHRLRAARILRQFGRPERLLIDERLARPWEVLPGCDLALGLSPHAGALPVQWAMAAGVPVVAQADYAVCELLEDRHSALLVKPGSLPALAHRATQVLTDAELALRLRETARHEVFGRSSRTAYCQGLGAVYEQVVAGPAAAVA